MSLQGFLMDEWSGLEFINKLIQWFCCVSIDFGHLENDLLAVYLPATNDKNKTGIYKYIYDVDI